MAEFQKVTQTKTLRHLLVRPDKATLLEEFSGKTLDQLRTPCMIIDRNTFMENCAKMHKKARDWGATFRAHLKTHKTAEGTRLQLISAEGNYHAVVVSTLLEAWEVVHAGLVADYTVKDILYGLPVAINKILDLSELRDAVEPFGGVVRLLVDNIEQVKYLQDFESQREKPKKWSVFVKINGGENRAGVPPRSTEFLSLLSELFSSPAISVHGFYGHAGSSYGSKSLDDASAFLLSEVTSVNIAAQLALLELSKSSYYGAHTQPFVLSIGSTPTAHAATEETRAKLTSILHGTLELHAGNYPLLDLQQQSTGLIDQPCISQRVRATVISYYPSRGAGGRDEAMVDAGAIAFSKDTGPSGIYGDVIGRPWQLSRISQEHGILTSTVDGDTDEKCLKLGTVVDIIGQHACLIAAAYPWYYIVDRSVNGGDQVVDIWVPWKGW